MVIQQLSWLKKVFISAQTIQINLGFPHNLIDLPDGSPTPIGSSQIWQILQKVPNYLLRNLSEQNHYFWMYKLCLS